MGRTELRMTRLFLVCITLVCGAKVKSPVGFQRNPYQYLKEWRFSACQVISRKHFLIRGQGQYLEPPCILFSFYLILLFTFTCLLVWLDTCAIALYTLGAFPFSENSCLRIKIHFCYVPPVPPMDLYYRTCHMWFNSLCSEMKAEENFSAGRSLLVAFCFLFWGLHLEAHRSHSWFWAISRLGNSEMCWGSNQGEL